MNSLCRLVQAQEDFESSVKDMQEALDGLWARLEVLHTGVTLTKQGSRIHKDLASAQTEAQVSGWKSIFVRICLQASWRLCLHLSALSAVCDTLVTLVG